MNARVTRGIDSSLYNVGYRYSGEHYPSRRISAAFRPDRAESVISVSEYTNLIGNFELILEKPQWARQRRRMLVQSLTVYPKKSVFTETVTNGKPSISLPAENTEHSTNQFAKTVLDWLPTACFCVFAMALVLAVKDLSKGNYISFISSGFTAFVFVLLILVSLKAKKALYRQWPDTEKNK